MSTAVLCMRTVKSARECPSQNGARESPWRVQIEKGTQSLFAVWCTHIKGQVSVGDVRA